MTPKPRYRRTTPDTQPPTTPVPPGGGPVVHQQLRGAGDQADQDRRLPRALVGAEHVGLLDEIRVFGNKDVRRALPRHVRQLGA